MMYIHCIGQLYFNSAFLFLKINYPPKNYIMVHIFTYCLHNYSSNQLLKLFSQFLSWQYTDFTWIKDIKHTCIEYILLIPILYWSKFLDLKIDMITSWMGVCILLVKWDLCSNKVKIGWEISVAWVLIIFYTILSLLSEWKLTIIMHNSHTAILTLVC